MLLRKNFFSDYYLNKTAFVLNANAKNVTDKVVSELVDLIPAGDLFYSRSIDESEHFYRTILKRGYARVFSGGGDGTLVNAINTIRRLTSREFFGKAPAVGVLKLGTGNAMASLVGAKSAWIDVHHVVKGGNVSYENMDLVECENGELAPFAGIGYDGEILNDYLMLKNEHKGKPTEKFINSVLGYIWVALTRTMPRHIGKPQNQISIYSKSDSYKIMQIGQQTQEHYIPAGSLLYQGPACMVAVGSIPRIGYNFKMFPYSNIKPGHIQVRVCAFGLPTILTKIYPSIWNGTIQHPQLHDFLVQDVTIESKKELPFQIGGDAAGYKNKINFKIAENVVTMAKLAQQRLATPRGVFGLLPAPIFTRN